MRRRTVLALALALAVRAPALHAQQQAGGIVFVGSSIFHRWTALASQMAPLPVSGNRFQVSGVRRDPGNSRYSGISLGDPTWPDSSWPKA